MTKTKVALVALAIWLATLGGGWLWGAWGRWASEAQLRDVDVRARLAEARASLLAARVDLFEINFGKASAEIERAKRALNAAAELLDQARRTAAAGAVREAMRKAAEAQHLAGGLDQAAGSRLVEALAALDRSEAGGTGK